MAELVRSASPEVPMSFDSEHEDNHYNKGLSFKLHMETDHKTIEIGDIGFVDWIAAINIVTIQKDGQLVFQFKDRTEIET
jgi:hypothetical protein